MRAEKKYLIDEVEVHLRKSDYVILANFTGVTVADAADLRLKLSAEKAEYHVVKNSSLRVAAKSLGLPEFDAALVGPTAIVVGGKNSAGVAKILKQFFKDKQKVEVKAGVLSKKLISQKDVERLADMPSLGGSQRGRRGPGVWVWLLLVAALAGGGYWMLRRHRQAPKPVAALIVDAGAAEDSVLQCPASNTNSCFRTAGRFLPLSPLFLISSLRRPGLARKMRC